MKIIINTILAGVFCLSVLGCKSVSIKNGRIPAEYLQQVKEIEGSYTGQMNYESVTLDVRLVGDYLKVTANPDILGSGCEARIGDLTKVWVKGQRNNYEVTDADFKFEPNLCSTNVMGRTLSFSVKKTNGIVKLNASILERMDSHQVCQPVCTNPPGGCYNTCHFEDTPIYLSGKFIRQQ